MQVILTGATGFVGSELLAQLIARPEVSHITCLARRPLAQTSPKLELLLHDDFARYSSELAARLALHSGCLWAIGGKASDSASPEEFARVTRTFTLSCARSVAQHLSRPFRFCYLSGMGADPSESARLPWERATRHLKGRVERELEQLTLAQPLFHASSFRPAGILPRQGSSLLEWLLAPITVRVDQLAKAMIDELVLDSERHYRMVSNQEIRRSA